MKFMRFAAANGSRYGLVDGNQVRELEGDIFGSWRETGATYSIGEVEVLTPVENPQKVICIGLNYQAHAEEKSRELPSDPMMFMVSQTSLVPDGADVILPDLAHVYEHEAELVAIVGKEGRDIPEEKALEYVFGYTLGNDVSDRTLQKLDKQFTRAKSFPTFKPFGPVIETELDPSNLDIKLWLNGEIKQDSNTSLLIHSLPKLIRVISEVMTLYPGDLIFTGTPAGVSPMRPGDVMEIEIESIGRLRNPVRGK